MNENPKETDSRDFTSVQQVRIEILDVNDHAPFWRENTQRHVIEFRDGDPMGKRQTLPLAIDLDQGENAKITYSLEQDPTSSPEGWTALPFSLIHDSNDGSLYIQSEREIDHEVASSYKLILRAVDGVENLDPISIGTERFMRQHTSTLAVTVVVQDINDNDPKFIQPVFTPDRPISETTPVGSIVLRLKATDADSGENGAFHFGFAPNVNWQSVEALAQQLFDVRPNGTVVVRRQLDVDRQWQLVDSLKKLPGSDVYSGNHKALELSFKVVVEDEADPRYARSSEAMVKIVVADENDEPPVIEVTRPATSIECIQSLGRSVGLSGHFSSPMSFACVFENSPMDTVVATLQVH